MPQDACACSTWRNVGGQRLEVLRTPSAAEAECYLEPGAVFEAVRVAVVSGCRFLQLADGRGWVPECSREDSDCVLIEMLRGDAAATAREACLVSTPPLDGTVRVRYLRITVGATRSTNTPHTQLSEISLRYRDKVLSLEGFSVENPCGSSPPREHPEKLLTARGKWLDQNFRLRGKSVLFLTAPHEIQLDDLAFRTASDAPGRDPIDLRIDGSQNGWEWLVLHEMSAALYTPAARQAWSPWLHLRADPSLTVSDEPEGLASALPLEISWWRNVGKRLGVLQHPCEKQEPCDYLHAGSIFAALRVTTVQHRRYLQLPAGRGWVPECSRKDAARVVAVLAEPQDAPSPLVATEVGHCRRHDENEPIRETKKLCKPTPGDQAAASLPEPALAESPSCVARPVAVRQLRVSILSSRSGQVVSTQISQVCLRCKGDLVDMTKFVVRNPRGQSPSSEGPERVLNSAGKWLDMNFSTNGKSVLELVAPHEVEVEDISFCTANDEKSRDPVNLRIDGSRDGSEWFLLHDTGGQFPMPSCRRSWTPWLLLQKQGPAPEVWMPDDKCHDATRYRCSVPGCMDSSAAKEGYLIQGNLLRHMLRHHPEAEATAQLNQQMKCEKIGSARPLQGFKRGKATVHKFMRSDRRTFRQRCRASGSVQDGLCPEVVLVDAPVTPKRLKQPAPGAGHTTPFMTPARPQVPATGTGQGRKRRRNDTSNGHKRDDVQSPAKKSIIEASASGSAPALGNPARMLLRLSFLANAPLGKLVDVEAVIQSVGPLRKLTSKQRPGALKQVRRFRLQDGSVSCLWVMCGRRAERFDERLCGSRVILRGATIHVFRSARHLSGATHVDVCTRFCLD